MCVEWGIIWYFKIAVSGRFISSNLFGCCSVLILISKPTVFLGISAALQRVVTTVNTNKGAGHFQTLPIPLHGVVLVVTHRKPFDNLFSYKMRKTQLLQFILTHVCHWNVRQVKVKLSLYCAVKAFRGMDLNFAASLRLVLDEGVRQLHAATIFIPGENPWHLQIKACSSSP
jgi:hypothetical protein